MRKAFALLLAALAACGTSNSDTRAPLDETLRRETRAGDLAYTLERPDEAAARYRAAMSRALVRDDATAIGDAGYNLAVAELRANRPREALAAVRSTRIELSRRGGADFPELALAEATALYRTGARREADALAARVEASGGLAGARASFLRGLIADDAGDVTGLAAAAEKLRSVESPPFRADALELSARLALRRNAPQEAREEAMRAADLRRQSLDYRGLARTLHFAGEAAMRSGESRMAADLYVRAARSAAEQGDVASARLWLREAKAATRDPGIASAVRALEATLQSSQ